MKRLALALFVAALLAPQGVEASPPEVLGSAAMAGRSSWDLMFDEIPTPDFLRVAPPAETLPRPAPTAEQAIALAELQSAGADFVAAGGSYRATVDQLLTRELDRRRMGRARHYDAAIEAREVEAPAVRDDAIARLERFLALYPTDPQHTPDSMFRLAELYFAKSTEALVSGDPDAAVEVDHGPSIALLRDIVARFPDYQHVDAALYLLGYALAEMGEADEAKRAYLALVCSNHFGYAAPYDAAGLHTPLPAPQHAESAAAEGPTGYDPYAGCEPVVVDGRFTSETWFRLGEHHFDNPREPYGFDLAISAYARILDVPSDANRPLALYKVAWTYYRTGAFAEAVRTFAKILTPAEGDATAGRELRPEALRQIARALAFDDWNRDNRPDVAQGLPSGVERARDPRLLPQGAVAFDVLAALGRVYYDEARFEPAIEAWRAALERAPAHPDAPQVIDWIATAYRDAGDSAQEVATVAQLAGYVEGSTWWERNRDAPGAQERARALAEAALLRVAFHYHEAAQRARAGCDENADACLAAASALYAQAAQSYTGYLRAHPNDPEGYEVQYNRAEALFWSGRYEDAAVAYREVRDSKLDDRLRPQAARRVVLSLERELAAAVASGALELREDAPEVEAGTPPIVRPAPMPPQLQALANAREHYVVRVSDAEDEEHVRPAFAYNNALLLYRYGYWPQARARLVRILDARCSGAEADQSGEVAWQTLRTMALALEDLDELRRLGLFLEQRACTFAPGEGAMALSEAECAEDEHRERAECLRRADLNALEYRQALAVFAEAERNESQPAQAALFERAATMLVEAVDRNPGDAQAPIALEQAGVAFERTGRFEAASTLYQRIIDEVGPVEAESEQARARLDAIVSNAYFRLALSQNRFFDFDGAVANYRTLADAPRFAASTDPAIVARRRDALVNAAIILDRLDRGTEAVAYLRRVVAEVDEPALVREALYRIGVIEQRRGHAAQSADAYRELIRRFAGDPDAGALIVTAHFRLAELARARAGTGRDAPAVQQALADVDRAYVRTGEAPGSVAAEYAAEARFRLHDDIGEFETWRIDVGNPATIDEYSSRLKAAIQHGSAWAQRLHAAYDPVLEYRRPTWTIAAYVRQGRVFELLANAVLNAPFVLPRDIARQIGSLPPDAREDLRLTVEDRVRELLDTSARPLECVAVGRYALAVRAAAAGGIVDERTRSAIDRLQSYGEERIAACIAEVRTHDATMAPYQPGEFARAPRGRHPAPGRVDEPPALRGAP